MSARNDTQIPRGTVETRAIQLRSEVDFNNLPTSQALRALVKKYNGKIESCACDEREETLSIEPTGGFTIFLSAYASESRNNFTIAHELGHKILHANDCTNQSAYEVCLFTRRGSNRQEWEANWFAAELLMPADEFKRAAQKCNNNKKLLAQRFGVSPAAADVRLQTLLDKD